MPFFGEANAKIIQVMFSVMFLVPGNHIPDLRTSLHKEIPLGYHRIITRRHASNKCKHCVTNEITKEVICFHPIKTCKHFLRVNEKYCLMLHD